MDVVEDIKSRLSVEDVIGDYMELKRAGRNFRGLSPFNSEKSPSFMVSPEKQIWHDFSSGKGGNIFSFVMEVEGVDFRESLEILAKKAGLDISQYQKSDGKSRQQKEKLSEAVELATKYYQQTMLKNKLALEYVVNKRHFNKETLGDFRLGYAPYSGTALVDFLKMRGISEEIIIKAGLASRRYRGLGDMFRGRVMVSLADPQGAPIGFTARILSNDIDAPKYINTPQTPLYDKSRHVFGLHLAKDAIRKSGYVVIVEGNLDVIASHQAGVKNVVATAGTAITAYHLKALQRFTSDIRLCFDQDKAGINAAERAISVAQGAKVQLSIITIAGSKDPDELIQKDPKLWIEAIEKQQYALDWLIDRYKAIYDITTAQGKKDFTDKLMETMSFLEDVVERDHYLLTLAKLINVGEEAIRLKLDNFKSGKKNAQPLKKIAAPKQDIVDPYIYQDQILCLLVAYPLTRRILETESTPLVFNSADRQRVYYYLVANPHTSLNETIPEDLKDDEDYVKILLFKAEELYNRFDSNERLRELRDLTHKLTERYQKDQKTQLTEQIRNAELVGDEVLVAKLLNKFNELLKKEQDS
jgi:DNA primase